MSNKTERDRAKRIIELAQELLSDDDTAVDMPTNSRDIISAVSEGEDNGAFVKAWVWVSFAGTEFDKEIGS